MTAGMRDQVNDMSAGAGAVNILPVNGVSQQILPALPRLLGVEVGLTARAAALGDAVTMIVRQGGGELARVARMIPGGADGFWRFDLDGSGAVVTVGEPLTVTLEGGGDNVVHWKYVDGDRYPRGSAIFGGSTFDDNDFLFRTYGGQDVEEIVLAVERLIHARTGADDIRHRSPDADLGAGVDGLTKLASGDAAAARDVLGPLGFTVVSGEDVAEDGVDGPCGRPYAMALSGMGTEREWGLYLVDTSRSPRLCLAVPHPGYDEHCHRMAVRLWRAIPGSVLMMATVHRHTLVAGQEADPDAADPARNVDGLFHHAWTEVFGAPSVPQIQLHGYADRTPQTNPSGDLVGVQAVVSTGSKTLRLPLAQRIFDEIARRGLTVKCSWSNPPGDLLATTNEQGKHARRIGWGWVHVEVCASVRNAPVPRNTVTDAVAIAAGRP